MKQRKPLNIGDKVKYFGYDSNGSYSGANWNMVAGQSNDVVSFYDSHDNTYTISRRQVTHVKRKKKAVKVISDERFFMQKYGSHLSGHYKSLNDATSVAGSSCSEILELGIVARHKVE